MNRFRALLLLGLPLLFAGCATGGEKGNLGYSPNGVTATTVLKTDVTSDGTAISYPKADRPVVTAATVDFPPGAETGWHLHPVPVYAWVVAGSITVELEGGSAKTYSAGEAFVEAVGKRHNGRNTGSVPGRLLVYYMGAEGTPNVVRDVP